MDKPNRKKDSKTSKWSFPSLKKRKAYMKNEDGSAPLTGDITPLVFEFEETSEQTQEDSNSDEDGNFYDAPEEVCFDNGAKGSCTTAAEAMSLEKGYKEIGEGDRKSMLLGTSQSHETHFQLSSPRSAGAEYVGEYETPAKITVFMEKKSTVSISTTGGPHFASSSTDEQPKSADYHRQRQLSTQLSEVERDEMDCLTDMTNKIPPREWKRFGREVLDMRDDILDEIEQDNLSNAYEQRYQMVRKWKDEVGDVSSWFITLFQKSSAAGFKVVAETLKKTHPSLAIMEANNSGKNPSRTLLKSKFKSLPLCYPNNYKWDSKKGKLKKQKNVPRDKLVVCDEAISLLKSIKDYPVCVVSIAGDRRSGKSYILSQLQEPPRETCVFNISPVMRTNTIGIWMSGEIFLKKLSDGTEVAVILLDTEGLGSVDNMGEGDDPLFTLIVLISSVLIYNSNNIAKADDLQKLRFIGDLAKKIKVKSEGSKACDDVAANEFYRFFPTFLWLLRDVTLEINISSDEEEEDGDDDGDDDDDDDEGHMSGGDKCRESVSSDLLDEQITDDSDNTKEYFLKQVLKGGISEKHCIGEAILKFFPVFDAYQLPPPSVNKEVNKNITDSRYKNKINPEFIRKVKMFCDKVTDLMTAKKAWPKIGNVDGWQFAELVTIYTNTLNKPGSVPNIQSIWDQVVELRLQDVFNKAVDLYRANLDNFIYGILPCEESTLQNKHSLFFDNSLKQYRADSENINDAGMIDRYLEKLQDKLATYSGCSVTGGLLKDVLDNNTKLSADLCTEVAEKLLDGMKRNFTQDKFKEFKDVEDAMGKIDDDYQLGGKGPKKTEIRRKKLLEGIDKFYVDNIKWLKQLPGFSRPKMETERREEFEQQMRMLEDLEEASAVTDQMRHQAEKQIEIYEASLKKEKEERKADQEQQKEQSLQQLENMKLANEKNIDELKSEYERRQQDMQQEIEKNYEEKDHQNNLKMKKLIETIETLQARLSEQRENMNKYREDVKEYEIYRKKQEAKQLQLELELDNQRKLMDTLREDGEKTKQEREEQEHHLGQLQCQLDDKEQQLNTQKQEYDQEIATQTHEVDKLRSQLSEQEKITNDLKEKEERNKEESSKQKDKIALLASEWDVKYPDTWVDFPAEQPEDVPLCVPVLSSSSEYKKVVKRFCKNVEGAEITAIKRIQNRLQYKQYDSLKKAMEKKNPTDTKNERILYHGTRGERVDPVTYDRFDRAFAGTGVGAHFGKACYFAVNSGLPLDYHSLPDSKTGIKWMFQVRVLIGEYAQGERDMVKPPYKDEARKIRYDTIADNVRNPGFFGTFTDYQAYPEYIISFLGGRQK
ncbi:uncharacterized protein LOC144448548 [Glandiceps talaboti]